MSRTIRACALVVHSLGKSSSFYTQLKNGFWSLVLKDRVSQISAPQNQSLLHSLFLNSSPVSLKLDTLSTSPTTKTTLKLTKYRSIV